MEEQTERDRTRPPLAVPFIIGLVIVVFNVVALVILKRCKTLCRQLRLLAMNLTLSDMGVGCAYLLAFAIRANTTARACLAEKFLNFLMVMSIMVSLLTVTFMAVDRFLSLYMTFRYVTIVRKRRVIVLCIAIWMVAAILNGVAIARNLYQCDSSYVQGQNGRLIIVFAICGIAVSVCYLGLLQYVITQKKKVHVEKKYRNTFPILRPFLKVSIIVIAFVFFNMPLMVYLVLDMAYRQVAFKLPALYFIGMYLASMNSLINPILYVWRFQECKLQIQVILCFWNKKKLRSINTILAKMYAPFLDTPSTIEAENIVHI